MLLLCNSYFFMYHCLCACHCSLVVIKFMSVPPMCIFFWPSLFFLFFFSLFFLPPKLCFFTHPHVCFHTPSRVFSHPLTCVFTPAPHACVLSHPLWLLFFNTHRVYFQTPPPPLHPPHVFSEPLTYVYFKTPLTCVFTPPPPPICAFTHPHGFF